MKILRVIIGVLLAEVGFAQTIPNLFPYPNASGTLETLNVNGTALDISGAFFQSIGTNGRSCATCHQAAQGFSISTQELKTRFDSTHGLDPIFRTVDGSNCDRNIDTSSEGKRRQAYSLLLKHGIIRIPVAVPTGAEFRVVSVVNPYGCGDTATLSMYRRPLPTTNLSFLSTLMWDGRESSAQTGTKKITFPVNPGDPSSLSLLLFNLRHQAIDATTIHAQGTVPTGAQIDDIVNFEMQLLTAQAADQKAGSLTASGAAGGPASLMAQLPAFHVGINDPIGMGPLGEPPFTSSIFNLYAAWAGNSDRHRAQIARGEAIFNTKPINITGVAGLNDDLHLPVIQGFCGTCHDSPNVGNHSVSAPLNIGVGDLDSPLDVSYLPVMTLENIATAEIKLTTDPGRALITGKWVDVGRLKGPILRGLPARAPYFHNGSAETIEDAIEFYNKRFNVGFTQQEKDDLAVFLKTL
jgi:cytochrome c peroxidase